MQGFALFPPAPGAPGSGRISTPEQGLFTSLDLLERVRPLVAWLAEHAPAGDVRVLTQGRADTLTALVGCFLARRRALLVPQRQAAQLLVGEEGPRLVSLWSATDSRTDTFALAELPSSTAEQDGAGCAPQAPLAVELAPDQELVVVVTSGTSGQPERHAKTAAQLLGEVAVWRQSLAVGAEDVFLATVPGHHLFGLLFSFLLPLSAGARLATHARVEPEVFHPLALAEEAARVGATRLITVPAHLRTLLDADVELTSVRQVICSAAPLEAAWAREFEQRFGVEVLDVLGSTETGGLAVRRPSQAVSWTPLSGVRLRVDDDERLWVRSPFALGSDVEFETGDRGRLEADGSFVHGGRSDGVVKIGGKRVTLQEIEQAALRLSGVTDAVAQARPVSGLRGEELWLLVASESHDSASVKRHLQQELDAVFVPRRLRVLRRLPRGERGKLARADFLAAFQAEPTVTDAVRVLERGELTAGRVELTVLIPESSPRFEGHFPGEPVFPAVAQLSDLILPEARRYFGEGALLAISRLKFLARITPGLTLRLRLDGSRAGRIGFELVDQTQKYASGTLSLRTEPA